MPGGKDRGTQGRQDIRHMDRESQAEVGPAWATSGDVRDDESEMDQPARLFSKPLTPES